MTVPTSPGPTSNGRTVHAKRPAIYVGIAAVLALGSLLLPSGRSGAAATATDGPPAAPAASAPAAPCTTVVQSLRPGPLPPPGQMPAGSTMAAIAQRGLLRAGVDQGKLLQGYRNPISGQIEGSDIDVVRQIAKAIFGDENKVQYVVLNIADRASAVASGQVDLVVNSFTVTCARQQVVSFSAPYLTATQRLLVPVGSGINEVEDLAGKTVCTSAGSTTEGVLRSFAGVGVTTRPGIPDCVVEMQAGRVQAVSSDDVILAGLAAQDPQTVVVGRALDNASYAVAVPKGADDMVRFVNGVLEQGRRDGSLAASDRRWFDGHLSPLPTPPPAVYRD